MTDVDELESKIDELEWDIELEVDDLKKEIQRVREGIDVWNQLTEYTIPFSYEKKFLEINSFLKTTKHPFIVKAYREQISPKRDCPHFINQKRINNKKWLEEITFKNSAFLKNSKIFSDICKNLYWDTRPILAYYSSSYLLSFFINTYVAYESTKPHHGICIGVKDDPKKIQIYILDYGLFPRIVKSLSFIFYGSVFSDYLIDFSDLPLLKDNQVELYKNTNQFSIDNKNHFLLEDLLNGLIIRQLRANFRRIEFKHSFHGRHNRYISSSILLKDYILVFLACNLARYNPNLWKEIYEGKSSDLFLQFQRAIEGVENMVSFVTEEIKRWESRRDFRFYHSLQETII